MVMATIIAAIGVATKMRAPQPRLGHGLRRTASAIEVVLTKAMSKTTNPKIKGIKKAVILSLSVEVAETKPVICLSTQAGLSRATMP
jgi:hypothetical protein